MVLASGATAVADALSHVTDLHELLIGYVEQGRRKWWGGAIGAVWTEK